MSQKSTRLVRASASPRTGAEASRSIRMAGAAPMASARSRNSASLAAPSDGDTSATRTASSRGTTACSVSSATSASGSSDTSSATASSGAGTGVNVTTVSPSGCSDTSLVAASRPFTVRCAFTTRAAGSSRDCTRALTASSERVPSSTRRASITRTALLARVAAPTGILRSCTPAGRSMPAIPAAPDRCRSEITMISAAVKGASSSIWRAVRNAGASRVPRDNGLSVAMAASACDLSSLRRSNTSAASS